MTNLPLPVRYSAEKSMLTPPSTKQKATSQQYGRPPSPKRRLKSKVRSKRFPLPCLKRVKGNAGSNTGCPHQEK